MSPTSPLITALLDEVDAYRERTGLADTTIGRLGVNDPKFVRNLRAGRTCTVASLEKMQRYLRSQHADASAA